MTKNKPTTTSKLGNVEIAAWENEHEGKTFFNSSASHIMQRMRALGIFAERIASNPYLRCDAVVDSFLQDTEMAWDMVKEKIETAEKAKGRRGWRVRVR